MKIIIGAIALLIAAPAAAQSAPAADPHAGHAQHQHGPQPAHDHGQHQPGQTADHSKHMDCCKDGKHGDCCDPAKQQNGQKAKCCAEHGEHKGHGAKGA